MNPPTPSEQAAPGNGQQINQKYISDSLTCKSWFLQKGPISPQRNTIQSQRFFETEMKRGSRQDRLKAIRLIWETHTRVRY